VLHRQLLEIVRHDEVCRRLMTTPGVGPADGFSSGAGLIDTCCELLLSKPGHSCFISAYG
jgi:hypothetical protein